MERILVLFVDRSTSFLHVRCHQQINGKNTEESRVGEIFCRIVRSIYIHDIKRTYRSWYFACPPRARPINLYLSICHQFSVMDWAHEVAPGTAVKNQGTISINWRKTIYIYINYNTISIFPSFNSVRSAFLSSSIYLQKISLSLLLFTDHHGLSQSTWSDLSLCACPWLCFASSHSALQWYSSISISLPLFLFDVCLFCVR